MIILFINIFLNHKTWNCQKSTFTWTEIAHWTTSSHFHFLFSVAIYMSFYTSLFHVSVVRSLHYPKGHIILDNHNVKDNNEQSLKWVKTPHYIKDVERFQNAQLSTETRIM